MHNSYAYPTKLNDFFKKHQLISLPPKKIILKPNQKSDFVYFIKTGEIKKYTFSYKKEEVVLHIYKSGSFLPISESLDMELTNYFYYSSIYNVTTYKIPKQKIINFINDNPDIAIVLAKRLYLGLNDFLMRATTMMAGNAFDRVVYELYCELSHNKKDLTDNIPVSSNEKYIAAKTGLSRETVNRVIRRLKDMDCVEVANGKLIVKDYKKIKNWVHKRTNR